MCSTARRRFVTDRVRSRRRGPRLVLGLRPAYRGFGIRETESIDVHLLLRLRESPWTGYGPTSSRRRWAFALALPRANRERRRSSIPMGGHKIGARGCARRPARPPRRPASSTPWGAARGLGAGRAAPGGQPHGCRRRQPVFVGEGSRGAVVVISQSSVGHGGLVRFGWRPADAQSGRAGLARALPDFGSFSRGIERQKRLGAALAGLHLSVEFRCPDLPLLAG